MHAVDIKRFMVHQIGIAAVAIGVLTAGIIGTGLLSDVTPNSGAVTVSTGTRRVSQTETMRYLELNTQLPATITAPVRTSAVMIFLEQNTLLPDQTFAVTHGFAEIRFLEMNTVLPVDIAPKVQSFAEMRYLELNTQLPGSDTLYPPGPSESLPVVGDTRY
ncbi:hypothetical protein BH24CHL1_BH24CHL1_17920 [soil metagenome]